MYVECTPFPTVSGRFTRIVFSDPPEKENFDVCEPLLAWWPLAKDLVTHHLLQQPCCHFFGLRLCRDDDAAEWPWTSTRLVLQLGIAFR